MRAIVCAEHGLPSVLQSRQVEAPRPGPGDVLIDVTAAGVNFPDLLMVQNLYQYKPELPFIPGVEFSGTVADLGEGVTSFAPGDRVFGRIRHGAFCEQLVVSASSRIARVPDGLGLVEAAGLAVTYGTAVHALVARANLQAGDTLLVLGASGGVGLAAVSLGRHLGAWVIACASSTEGLDACLACGADAKINYQTEDLRGRIKTLTDNRGVDVVFDPVGGRHAEPALRSMAWAGRYLVIGFASGEIPRLPFNLALLKGCSVIGVSTGGAALHDPLQARRELAIIAGLCATGAIRANISQTLPLASAAEALQLLHSRQARGKIVLTL